MWPRDLRDQTSTSESMTSMDVSYSCTNSRSLDDGDKPVIIKGKTRSIHYYCDSQNGIHAHQNNAHEQPSSHRHQTTSHYCPYMNFQRRTEVDVAIHIFTAMLIMLSLLNGCAASTDFHFPDTKQGQFAQNLNKFHISWPSRVSHLGELVSQDVHFRNSAARSRRSVNGAAGSIDPNSTNTKATVETTDNFADNSVLLHYRIPLHSELDAIVRLTRTNVILAPSAVLEKKVSKFKNISDSVFATLEHHQGCHYAGDIQGERSSLVALSACDGLRGFLHLGDDEYLIEPIKGHNKSEGGGHPHLVYKRSAVPEHLDVISRTRQGKSTCGVKDEYDRMIKNRERYERHKKNTHSHHRTAPHQPSHKREKRSISIEKHVETLVVVDTEMVSYYENEDIETYVLTVMNMVATLFHDATIGNAVNIVIVRIILMQDPDEDLQITHHADKTLKSFCKWQKNINFRDDDHPNHHDVAVLMTRRNICSRNNEPCSTLGLSQVSGLCQPHRTCSINEDTGLSLAWTVTHEIGHNFGMKHDNQHDDCMSDPDIPHVMAAHLTWDKTPSTWSNCSRTYITKFLDRNWGYCLDDPPSHHDFKYPELPAGTMYDADHQCRLLYGEGAERCTGIEVLENVCSTLWCRVNNKCSTKLQPAAVGTICGIDKWCFAGQCVDISERPHAIDGQWGQWAEWTDCTRTCGAGVSISQRHCSNPPPSNGGKYCTGERKRYRICNTDNCPEDVPSFRAQQCSEFNEIPYKEATYEWEPLSTPDTPCQLHCKPKNLFFSVLLKDIVTDGTPCVVGSRHMCISGRCQHVGCDWIIDSSAREDRCGVCFGDGSTCKTIKQQFNETKHQGYVEATVIPAGARNIRVEEVAEASNFLALKNEAGEYYLNGHWFIQWSGDYEMAGTIIHYKRIGNKEKFLAPGPLKEPLHIMLLMQTHNPGVEFEYTVPKENATNNKKPEFSWDYIGWSHCTVSCGGGTQRSAVVCKEQETGLVDEMYCDQTTKPDDQLRECNVHLCPARWWTGPWQHCSITCGDKGTHHRTVICIRSLGSDEQIALEDQACEGLEKPVEDEPCHHKDPCPGLGVWELGEWSNCTRTCNGGVQFRKAVCIKGSRCSDEKPDLKRPCNVHKCTDDFGKEVINIEGGHEISSAVLPPDLSRSSSSSISTRTISISNNNELPLTDGDKNIVIGDTDSDFVKDDLNMFSHVSSHHQRHRRHHRHSQNKGSHLNVLTSSILIGKPSDRAKNGKISQVGHNASEPQKNEENFHFIWQAVDWSKCSTQCGQGERTREVLCLESNTRRKVNLDLCDTSARPTALDKCLESVCLEWQTGDWAECSATCGYATQFRDVFCTKPGQCNLSQKPDIFRACKELSPCIAWVYGDWSKCTKSCGIGSQERLVQCVNLTSQELSKECPSQEKPDERQECSGDDCLKDDNNAALSVSCESNDMSFNFCRMLKKVGLCHKQHVRAKCCRTCHDNVRPKLDEPSMSRR